MRTRVVHVETYKHISHERIPLFRFSISPAWTRRVYNTIIVRDEIRAHGTDVMLMNSPFVLKHYADTIARAREA